MKRRAAKKRLKASHRAPAEKIPLIEHVKELRRRVTYVAVSVAGWSIAAYAAEHQLINILLKPSGGQNFIYTSPMGGMNFLFSVCLYVGLVLSTPIIIYQVLAFLRPLMQHATRRFLISSSLAAAIAALAGVLFGYFIGLPSALHFLLHQFQTVQVRPLITIQSYMSFVGVYMLGSALMFQLPLIMIVINRITPLKPGTFLKYERHVIVFAFIAAFIMNPTPNVIDQMMVVVPIIIMYQVGIFLIWFINRHGNPKELAALLQADAQRRAERARLAAQDFSKELVSTLPQDLTPAFATENATEAVDIPPPPADTIVSGPKRASIPLTSRDIKVAPRTASTTRQHNYIDGIAPRRPGSRLIQ